MLKIPQAQMAATLVANHGLITWLVRGESAVYALRRDFLAPGPPAGREPLGRSDCLSIFGPVAGKEDRSMALFMFQAAYTAEAVAAQIKEPQDRIEAVRASAEAVGARIIAGGYSFGDYDVMILAEAPDDVTAASISLATVAGGAVRLAKTTRLLSGQEWVEALQKAQRSEYRPPGSPRG